MKKELTKEEMQVWLDRIVDLNNHYAYDMETPYSSTSLRGWTGSNRVQLYPDADVVADIMGLDKESEFITGHAPKYDHMEHRFVYRDIVFFSYHNDGVE